MIKEKGLPDEKTEMYFDRILVATERMRSLIESLHAFSATKNENLKVENCNLNEMFAEIEMTEVLKYEQILKEARQLLDPKEKPVTQYEQKDVDQLDYDETIKAIRSIQSKKTLSKWLTDIEGDNDEYRKAVEIEKMLIERRNNIKPVDNEYIRKTDLQTIIDTIEGSGNLSQEKVVELLKKLI